MLLQSIFALNILIHVALGAYVIKVLLKGFNIKASWQQTLLLTLGVVVGMQLITKALQLFETPNRIVLVVISAWAFLSAGGFVSTTYNLKNKKLYLTSGTWAFALLMIGFLISVLDRILLFGI